MSPTRELIARQFNVSAFIDTWFINFHDQWELNETHHYSLEDFTFVSRTLSKKACPIINNIKATWWITHFNTRILEKPIYWIYSILLDLQRRNNKKALSLHYFLRDNDVLRIAMVGLENCTQIKYALCSKLLDIKRWWRQIKYNN